MKGLKHNGCITIQTQTGARGRRLVGERVQNTEMEDILSSLGIDQVQPLIQG